MSFAKMIATVLAVLTLAQPVSAEQPTRDGIYIIFDGSNSMWGELPDKSRKIVVAKDVLTGFASGDFAGQDVALRIYGHRRKSDCSDTELAVPFADPAESLEEIQAAVQSVSPRGKTPISRSLTAALDDFGDRQGDILLISDGIETCDQDPCELMAEWRDKGIDIRVHVVGFGLDDVARTALTCVADTSGGQYFDADSADQLSGALEQARTAAVSERPEPSEPDPRPQDMGYALRIVATDDQGRAYRVKGPLFKNGEEIGTVQSYFRNGIEGPGDYEIEVGPVLRDGTTYKPVRVPVSVTEPGDTKISVTVTRPAILTASFSEAGEEHSGSNVSAWIDDEEVFRFRAFDEALARPGTYEFRAQPNDDNALTLTETLVEGEATDLKFELIRTVRLLVSYALPDGSIVKRGGALYRDSEKLYSLYANNWSDVRPGTYELHSPDRAAPLLPTEIEVPEAPDQELIVPLAAGFIEIAYADSPYYHAAPDRAQIEALDRKGGAYGSLDKPILVAPGKYKIIGQSNRGAFDDIEVEVVTGATSKVVFEPKPQGWLLVTYAPSDKYLTEPDRASIVPLEKQKVVGSNRINVKRMMWPGRYRIEGWRAAGNIETQEIEIKVDETTEVVLRLQD